MQTLEWRFVDKSSWPCGAWQNEPDKKQWLDEETGYPCLIHRAPMGALCGYVGVSKAHPLYGIGYENFWFDESHSNVDIDVHGGLTYSDFGMDTAESGRGIGHLTEDEDKIWWFGFDCAHLHDFIPGLLGGRVCYGESSYKPLAYVETHVKSLAKQLKELEKYEDNFDKTSG